MIAGLTVAIAVSSCEDRNSVTQTTDADTASPEGNQEADIREEKEISWKVKLDAMALVRASQTKIVNLVFIDDSPCPETPNVANGKGGRRGLRSGESHCGSACRCSLLPIPQGFSC